MKKITQELATHQSFRNYLFFWAGQLFSILGSSISQFVIIWWLTETTGSLIILSIANFLYVLPLTIIFFIAGVITDRFDRKKIIIIVDSLQAFVMLTIIILFNFGVTNPILIIIINSFQGLFQGFHIPTVSAIVPTMVPKDKLSRINGANFLLRSSIQIIGPTLGATLLAFIPINILLWIDPITFLIALIPLMLIKIPSVRIETTTEKKKSFIEDFKIGFQTLKLIPVIFMMLLLAMFTNFLRRPLPTLLPYYIKFIHSGSASNLAFIVAFMNVGVLIGASICSIKKKWKHSIPVYFGSFIINMVMYTFIAFTPQGNFIFMSIAMLISGMTIPLINTVYLTMMQLKVPADKMGRISSIDWAISMAISPIASIIAGPLAEILGISNLFFYCSLIGITLTIIFWQITIIRAKNNKKEKTRKAVMEAEITIDSLE